MNMLRHATRSTLKRCCYSTSAPFVPPASMHDVRNSDNRRQKNSPKPRPESPTFYTARSAFYDTTIGIESSIEHSRSALRSLHLLPLPSFARASLPPLHYDWKPKAEMEEFMQCSLSIAKYRRVQRMLNELNDLRRIAETAGCEELKEGIVEILDMFKKSAEDPAMRKKPVKFDEFGRTYTTGRRKTSTARVWIIPAKPQTTSEEPLPKTDETLENLLGLEPTSSESSTVPVIPSTILVNNLPLASYFALPTEREKVIRPLKLTGVLGGYNVFALVRGGGTGGQSGAIMHGIAKGLAAHEPQMAYILKKAKLLRRDPRMVERKKTGLVKARKARTWVKR